MGETAKAIAEFLRINKRTAFALFAAGCTLLILVKSKAIDSDPTWILLAYVSSFGFFVWAGFMVQIVMRNMQLRRRRIEQQQKQKELAGAQAAASAKSMENDKRTAIDNLKHLELPEKKALYWVHHKGLRCVRASQNWDEFQNLVNMKILVVEDVNLPRHDRFFLVPDYIAEALEDRLGPSDPKEAKSEPPWMKVRV